MAIGEPSPTSGFKLEPVQVILLLVIVIEVVLFSWLGTNFATLTNGLEVVRLSVEIGLLALALTPVIVGGGIDLSVGSTMGLVAVILGLLWRDAGWPLAVASSLAVGLGGLAGLFNGLLITRLKIPPLIVTIGTYSLYRGLAQGLTGGTDNVTDFPDRFLFLGQGYLVGGIPAQLPILLIAALGFAVLMHRSTVGRSLRAIGFSPEGARHAGVPVDRLIAWTYVGSGLVAGLAAVIYVAHLGQAKSDAGTGYELSAITAVVLGGTSIFGGRGSIAGTVLGLLAIAILNNGLTLADLPREVAGILTGTLLLVAIGLDRQVARRQQTRRPRVAASSITPDSLDPTDVSEAFVVKNSHVAILSAVILVAALLIAGSNLFLAQSVLRVVDRGETGTNTISDAKAVGRPLTIAMMPKSKGNAYFIACKQGADEAAEELGITLLWDGPTDPDPAGQNQIIDTWITRGVDAIAVAVENRDGIASVLRKAQDRGIPVITWDSDAAEDSRSFFVNQATPEGIGMTLMDTAAEVMDGQGQFAIITGSLTAANMVAWQEAIQARLADRYPEIALIGIRPCDDQQPKAYEEANTILNAYPDVKLIMAICSPAVPGAAEAVKQQGREDVAVIGLGLPNDNKRYVYDGITEAVILWNTIDLGYLAVHAATALASGELQAEQASFTAGRLGTLQIEGSDILLGEPFLFDAENIDQFDF